jgi:fumarate reductase flavoprotein subunit
MKKRITALALAVVMVMGTVALAAGTEKSITVTPMDLNVNGYAVTPTKSNGEAAEVFAYDGATYAPIRYIAELLGIDVEWDKTAPNTAKLANVPGFVPPAASASLKDGSYTGVGTGKNGDVTVEVTVANGAISAVKVLSHSETPGISDPAIERIPAAIVDGQTVEVNAVAGATMTGDAILTAVKSCIQQAGGDPAAFGKKQETVSGKTVEYEADIVIVGAGAAGLMAALTASEAGAKVIVMEKAANALASNFAQCGGPAGAETTVAKEAGVTVTNKEIYDHLYDFSNTTVDAKLLWEAWSRAGVAIDKMVDLGIPFSLNEDVYGVGFRSRHQFSAGGNDRIGPITSRIEAKGGKFLYETPGKSIIMDNGKAVGVQGVNADGDTVIVKAKAVMTCTGGFQGSPEMLQKYLGNADIVSLGSNTPTGDGINMVLEAGGALDRNFGVLGNEFAGATSKLPGATFDFSTGFNLANQNLAFWIYGGLNVDRDGDRFINEKLVADFPLALGGEAILRQGKVYTVMDETYYNACCDQGIINYLGAPKDWASKAALVFNVLPKAKDEFQTAVDQGWAIKVDTLAEAAEHFGLKNLEATVAEYNKMCAKGEDTLFGKSPNFMKSIGKGPYYVFEYEPSAWSTFGGVKTDSYLRAVDANGDYIPGLYCGGCEVGSYYAVPYYDGPGSCVAIAVGSGIWAAENMLDYIGK